MRSQQGWLLHNGLFLCFARDSFNICYHFNAQCPGGKRGSWASSCMLVNVSSQVPISRPADSSYCRLFTMKSGFVLMSADCWEKHTVCLRVWGRAAAAEPSLPLPSSIDPSRFCRSQMKTSCYDLWDVISQGTCTGPLPPTLYSGWGETCPRMKSMPHGPWDLSSTPGRKLTICTVNTWIWVKMWYELTWGKKFERFTQTWYRKNKCQWALCNWRPIKKKAKAEIEG